MGPAVYSSEVSATASLAGESLCDGYRERMQFTENAEQNRLSDRRKNRYNRHEDRRTHHRSLP